MEAFSRCLVLLREIAIGQVGEIRQIVNTPQFLSLAEETGVDPHQQGLPVVAGRGIVAAPIVVRADPLGLVLIGRRLGLVSV